jgi:hypothetical protein
MSGKHAAGQQQTDYTDQDRDQLNRALDAIEEQVPAAAEAARQLREPDTEQLAVEYLHQHWNRGVLPTLTECFMAGYRAGEASK